MRTWFVVLSTLICSMAFSQSIWMQKNEFPSCRYFHTSFTIGDTAFVGLGAIDAAGATFSSEFFRYDYANDVWIGLNDFPGGGRYAPTTFVIGGYAYLCFGVNDTHQWVREVWKYEKEGDTWTRLQDFPGMPRYHAASFVIDGFAYIVGGSYNEGWDYLNDTWQYDPAQDAWIQKAPIPTPHKAVAVGFTHGNCGFVGTGSYDLHTASNDFWKYDPVQDSWTALPPLPEVPRTAAVSFILNDTPYVGTGTDYYDTFKTFWYLDVNAATWNAIASLPSGGEPRYGATAFVLYNTAFLVAGRPVMFPGYCSILSDVWSYTLPLGIPRKNVTELNIYPNPVDRELTISCTPEPEGDAAVSLMDMMGRGYAPICVSAHAGTMKLDLSCLPSGPYILTIRTRGEPGIRTFLIKK